MLTQHQVAVRFPRETIIWIRPSKVNQYISTKRPMTRKLENFVQPTSPILRPIKKISKLLHPFVLNENAFSNLNRFDACYQYSLIADLFEHKSDYKKSFWYKKISADIEEFGKHMHKKICLKSTQDVEAFFEGYALDLINSMKTTGYDEEKAKDYGAAIIGKNGEVYKSRNGRHRFAAAKIVDTPRFPLRIIGVHMQFLGAEKDHLTVKNFRTEIQRVIRYVEKENS